MLKRRLHLLAHPAFILSLALLLFNDLSLKYEFHNWFTGKLSDFAGLFVLGIFLIAFFPRHRIQLLTGVGLFFIWWKSPLADGFISFCQNQVSLPVDRVVDYTDLIALPVLMLALFVANSDHQPIVASRHGFIVAIGFVSLFAFCFTSMPRNAMYYSEREYEINFYQYFPTNGSEDDVLKKLDDLHIRYYQDSTRYYRVRGELVLRTNTPNDSDYTWSQIPNKGDSVVYFQRTESPFYVIPKYTIENYELKDVRFRFSPGKKRNDVVVMSFQSKEYFEQPKLKKKFKRHFQKLF